MVCRGAQPKYTIEHLAMIKTLLDTQAPIRAFIIALQFLTRIPTPQIKTFSEQDQARAALFYPIVGLLIGVILVLVSWQFNAVNPNIIAAILTLIWVGITGALHLDGLADSSDAWMGGLNDIEKTHRIMKDPLLGTGGVVAIVLILLLKFSALTVLVSEQQFLALLLAPVIGRASILLMMLSTDYARKQGLVSAVIEHLNLFAVKIILGVIGLFCAWVSLKALLILCALLYLLRRVMIRRINGFTGDTLGATVEISEAFWLLAITLFL